MCSSSTCHRAAVPLWSALLASCWRSACRSLGRGTSCRTTWCGCPASTSTARRSGASARGCRAPCRRTRSPPCLVPSLPAAIVQRLVLFAALFLLAVGAARLAAERPLLAQLAAATLRCGTRSSPSASCSGIGRCCSACAAFPWLIDALARQGGPRWAARSWRLAATALTPATGVMGSVVGVVSAWRRGVVGSCSPRRWSTPRGSWPVSCTPPTPAPRSGLVPRLRRAVGRTPRSLGCGPVAGRYLEPRRGTGLSPALVHAPAPAGHGRGHGDGSGRPPAGERRFLVALAVPAGLSLVSSWLPAGLPRTRSGSSRRTCPEWACSATARATW